MPARSRPRRAGDLSAAARRQHPRAHLVPDARPAIRLPRHAQRVDLDRGLFHRARERKGGVPADLPLRLSSLQRGGALAARDVRQRRQVPGGAAHPRRERDRRRHRRTRRAALRPRQERLLVRLAALHRGDAPRGALPERHRPAGDLGRARRHGLGAGEPECRHRRSRRDGFPPLPRSADALSRPGERLLYRLDPARPTVPASSRRTSTRPIRGSSGTCWCGKSVHCHPRRPQSGREGDP